MKNAKKTVRFSTFMQDTESAPFDEDENAEEEHVSSALRQIVETGSITVEKDGHAIHCLTIIGQIEGHYILPPQNKTTKYEHVIPQLVAIEESDGRKGGLLGIKVWICKGEVYGKRELVPNSLLQSRDNSSRPAAAGKADGRKGGFKKKRK